MPTIGSARGRARRRCGRPAEVPLVGEPALDHDLAARRRHVAAGDDRVAAAAAEHDARARPCRCSSSSVASDTLLISKRYERAARFGSARTRRVDVADVARATKRAMTSGRSARAAARVEPVPGRSRPSTAVPTHDRGGEHAERGQQRAPAARAQPGERDAPARLAAGPPRAAARGRRRSAAAASWVTSTTARPSSAPGAQQPSTSRAGVGVEVAGRLVGEQHGGSLTSARAIAKRCCSPPESWCGSAPATGAQPEPRRSARRPRAAPSRVRAAQPRRRAARSPRPSARGSRWKNWKTKPIAPAPQRAQRALAGAGRRARRPTSIVPASGRSSPPSRCSSVDLPEPERPRTATSSPASTCERAPSSTRRAARPSPYGLHEPACAAIDRPASRRADEARRKARRAKGALRLASRSSAQELMQ